MFLGKVCVIDLTQEEWLYPNKVYRKISDVETEFVALQRICDNRILQGSMEVLMAHIAMPKCPDVLVHPTITFDELTGKADQGARPFRLGRSGYIDFCDVLYQRHPISISSLTIRTDFLRETLYESPSDVELGSYIALSAAAQQSIFFSDEIIVECPLSACASSHLYIKTLQKVDKGINSYKNFLLLDVINKLQSEMSIG